LTGGAAQTAGLSSGDILLAIDGLRVTPATLPKQLARHPQGGPLKVHVFRRDELMEFDLHLAPPEKEDCQLLADPQPNALRRKWLGA
jgi:predicted metalloprotease with PDZ domain